MQVDRTTHTQHHGRRTEQLRRYPFALDNVLWIGLAVAGTSWALAWFGPEPVRWYTFFPLWLGYILTVDGINLRRSGSSLLSRDPAGVAGLFLLSTPFWWVFEGLNERLGNWEYHLPIDYPPLIYGLLASIAFSTVIPAVFETAELCRSFTLLRQPRRWRRIVLSRRYLVMLVAAGGAMFLLVLLFPRFAFPLAWLSLFFIVDPINALRGRRSIVAQVANGRWETVLSLFAAGITCGFFWEMWNFWSVPNWEYHVPFVGFGKLFEMPILGYGGYLPFALEIYALWALVSVILPGNQATLVRFDTEAIESGSR